MNEPWRNKQMRDLRFFASSLSSRPLSSSPCQQPSPPPAAREGSRDCLHTGTPSPSQPPGFRISDYHRLCPRRCVCGVLVWSAQPTNQGSKPLFNCCAKQQWHFGITATTDSHSKPATTRSCRPGCGIDIAIIWGQACGCLA